MTSTPGTPTADGISLRPLLRADIPFANELRRLSRWNQTEADWHGYLDYEPAGCFVAELEGTPVGTATTVRYGPDVGWIGMVVVHPAARSRGVGKRLLRHAIAYLKACGVRCVRLDATPMGKVVYVPLGFRDEYEVRRYEGIAVVTAGDSAVPERAYSEIPAGAIAAFDAAAFGTPRGPVLASLSRRVPDFCFAASEAGTIRGYLIAREGSDAVQIAPWVAREDIASGKLVALPLGRRNLTRNWGVLHRRGRRLSMSEEEFVTLCRREGAQLVGGSGGK